MKFICGRIFHIIEVEKHIWKLTGNAKLKCYLSIHQNKECWRKHVGNHYWLETNIDKLGKVAYVGCTSS